MIDLSSIPKVGGAKNFSCAMRAQTGTPSSVFLDPPLTTHRRIYVSTYIAFLRVVMLNFLRGYLLPLNNYICLNITNKNHKYVHSIVI